MVRDEHEQDRTFETSPRHHPNLQLIQFHESSVNDVIRPFNNLQYVPFHTSHLLGRVKATGILGMGSWMSIFKVLK